MSAVDTAKGIAFAPLNFVNSASRHVVDLAGTGGSESARYNARDAYRTKYNAADRAGAAVGTAAMVALPALGLASWASKGAKVPLATGNAVWVGRAAGAAVVGGIGVAAAFKLKDIVEDDGHLGSIGATAGIAAGGLVGWKLLNKPMVGAGLAIAGGIAGHLIGSNLLKVGPGHIGESIANPTKLHGDFPGTTLDFARGAFNHFSESGPQTQSFALANAWDAKKTLAEGYSRAEYGGALVGDLAAAGLMGGGALAVAASLTKTGTPQITSAAFPRLAARANGMIDGAIALSGTKGAAVGLGATAVGLAAWTVLRENDAWSKQFDNPAAGLIAGGAALAVGAGAAKVAMNTGIVKAMSPTARTMAGVLTGAVLISALSAARVPVMAFINDSKLAGTKLGEADPAAKAIAMGAGGLAGAAIGFGVANKLGSKVSGVPKLAITAAGIGIGAVVGGLAGMRVAPTLPGGVEAGVSGAVGAGLLGVGSYLLTKNVKSAATAAAAGAVAGIASSSMLGGENLAPAAPDAPVNVLA